MPIGARISSARTDSRARWRRAAARPKAGRGDLDWTAGLPATFRMPPAPYREAKYSLGPGFCCVCGQPVYRFGWHKDLWNAGPNSRAVWHTGCVAAWRLWTAPSTHDRMLRKLQSRRCGQTGRRLWKAAEVDHHMPLFRVWREQRDAPWPTLLNYWGVPNLQVINRDVHAAKCADEANYRREAATESVAPSAATTRSFGSSPAHARHRPQYELPALRPLSWHSA